MPRQAKAHPAQTHYGRLAEVDRGARVTFVAFAAWCTLRRNHDSKNDTQGTFDPSTRLGEPQGLAREQHR